MNKAERAERLRDYLNRSPRDLADALIQADEAIEKRAKREAALRRRLDRVLAAACGCCDAHRGQPARSTTAERGA